MPSRRILLAVALGVTSHAVGAQQPLKLSVVLSAFLADSGVATRGLPWTTGSALPVKWKSAKPVPSAEYLKKQGFTLSREGTARVIGEGSEMNEVVLHVRGYETGIQQFAVYYDFGVWDQDGIERALIADGFDLKPLKCSRKTEPASTGNAVYIAKVPRKVASGLWESWDCAGGARGCTLGFTILYRRNDVNAVECMGGR